MSEGNPVSIKDIYGDVELIGDEGTEPGYAYEVKTYRFPDDETKDAAEIFIHPNGFIPPELIQRGPITDHPIKGSGLFIILSPGGELKRIKFDSKNPTPESSQITYGEGSYIAWRAYDEGLTIVEVCSPPVKNAVEEFKVLDIKDPTIPEEFKAAYIDLISSPPGV